MSKLIKRDWRNWEPEKSPSGGVGSGSGKLHCNKTSEIKKAVSINLKPVDMSKIVSKTSKNTPRRLNYAKGGLKYNKNNLDLKSKDFSTREKRQKILDKRDYLDWSESFNEDIEFDRNDNRARGIVSVSDESKDRRLANTLANIISKLAEDKTGEPIIGEDEWDVKEIMMRSITKRSIYSCMQSRERENIILVLDSSPSCSQMAMLYAKIAFLSVKIGCLDIYLAPNAFVTHKMDNRTGKYTSLYSIGKDKSFLLCDMDRLDNFFSNRVILFFGDYDGHRHIAKASHKNEIHWFNQDYEGTESDKQYLSDRKFDGNVYPCLNRKDLISITKTIR